MSAPTLDHVRDALTEIVDETRQHGLTSTLDAIRPEPLPDPADPPLPPPPPPAPPATGGHDEPPSGEGDPDGHPAMIGASPGFDLDADSPVVLLHTTLATYHLPPADARVVAFQLLDSAAVAEASMGAADWLRSIGAFAVDDDLPTALHAMAARYAAPTPAQDTSD